MNPAANRDEIDLTALVQRLWATRKLVVVLLLAVTVVYWGLWGTKELNRPAPTSYIQVVGFTFSGIEQGKYPNGSQFLLADIIAPNVLTAAYDANGLAEAGVSQADFFAGFNIEPYALDSEFILEKYKQQLGRKGITPQEIEELNGKLNQELKASAVRSAKLTFQAPKVKLDEATIAKILHDVPRIWADQAIDLRGVFNIDVPLYSDKVFAAEQFANLDFLVAFDLIEDKIALLNSNVETLLKQPNGRVVRDEATGWSLFDIKNNLSDVRDYDIQQIISPIKDLGIARNSDVVLLYYQRKIRDLELVRENQLAYADIAAKTLTEYGSGQGRSGQAGAGAVASGMQAAPQLGEDFLQRIMDMTEQSSDVKFRQEIARRIIEYREAAAKTQFEITKLSEVTKAMNGNNSAEKNGGNLRAHYEQQVREMLPAILLKLKEAASATMRLHAKLSRENYGLSGNLYRNLQEGISVSYKPVSKQTLVGYAAALFVATMLGIVAGLLWLALKGARREADAAVGVEPRDQGMVDFRASQARSSAG